jgi:hypothetical protein
VLAHAAFEATFILALRSIMPTRQPAGAGQALSETLL